MFDKYKKLENKIKIIIDLLETKKNTKEYYYKYKGIATLLSPLYANPDILFLGINSGDGAFNELNGNNKTNKTPLRIIGEDESFIKGELDWFKPNTARGGIVNGEWEAYEWFQRDKKINNKFPANMIDLLFMIAEKKYHEITSSNNCEPTWKKEISEKIIYTNLYPIITKNTAILKAVHKSLLKEDTLRHLWESEKPKEWDVRKYFISLTHELVDLVKPKIIICMGTTAFNDFTYTHDKKDDKIFTSSYKNIPIIGFNRSGNWTPLLPELANRIYAEL